MPDPGWCEALWPDPARVIRDIGVQPGMTVVDLCSGDGWFTLPLAKIAKTVVAIDIDAKLIATSRVRLAEAGLTNSTFVEADAYDLGKVVVEPADYIFLANAFHGVPARLASAVRGSLRMADCSQSSIGMQGRVKNARARRATRSGDRTADDTMLDLGQPMLNAIFLAAHTEHVCHVSCRRAVCVTRRESELDPVVGENRVDLCGNSHNESFKERRG